MREKALFEDDETPDERFRSYSAYLCRTFPPFKDLLLNNVLVRDAVMQAAHNGEPLQKALAGLVLMLLKPRDKPLTVADQVQQVNAAYLRHHPRSAKVLTQTSKEFKLIAERLREGYSVEDLCAAVDGCHISPFHCGQNDAGKKYQDLALIMRDSSKVANFIEYADGKKERHDPRGNFAARDAYLAMGGE